MVTGAQVARVADRGYTDVESNMAGTIHWAFPADMQPKEDELAFDLDGVLDAVVLLRAEIPEDGFTASILGTERAGYGIVIRDDGLVLTIGYLIT